MTGKRRKEEYSTGIQGELAGYIGGIGVPGHDYSQSWHVRKMTLPDIKRLSGRLIKIDFTDVNRGGLQYGP